MALRGGPTRDASVFASVFAFAFIEDRVLDVATFAFKFCSRADVSLVVEVEALFGEALSGVESGVEDGGKVGSDKEVSSAATQ